MGQVEVARAAFEKALASSGAFPEKEEAQRRLASLKNRSASSETHETMDVVAFTRRAEDNEKNGKPAEAVEAYEKAFRLNPKLALVALKLAALYAGPLHKPDKAMDYARKARELAPKDVDAAVVLGRVAAQSGNLVWGYSLLQDAARQRPDDPNLLYDLAMASYALGKVSEARETMQRSVEAKPDAPKMEEIGNFLAFTALDLPAADVMAAQSKVDQTLAARPDYVPALMVRGAILIRQGRPSAAADVYSDILRKYPDFAPAQMHLASIYVQDPEKAAEAFDLATKARRTLGDDPELVQTLTDLKRRKAFASPER
jgi:tetratricopeptide (TPR) repeat protein